MAPGTGCLAGDSIVCVVDVVTWNVTRRANERAAGPQACVGPCATHYAPRGSGSVRDGVQSDVELHIEAAAARTVEAFEDTKETQRPGRVAGVDLHLFRGSACADEACINSRTRSREGLTVLPNILMGLDVNVLGRRSGRAREGGQYQDQDDGNLECRYPFVHHSPPFLAIPDYGQLPYSISIITSTDLEYS